MNFEELRTKKNHGVPSKIEETTITIRYDELIKTKNKMVSFLWSKILSLSQSDVILPRHT